MDEIKFVGNALEVVGAFEQMVDNAMRKAEEKSKPLSRDKAEESIGRSTHYIDLKGVEKPVMINGKSATLSDVKRSLVNTEVKVYKESLNRREQYVDSLKKELVADLFSGRRTQTSFAELWGMAIREDTAIKTAPKEQAEPEVIKAEEKPIVMQEAAAEAILEEPEEMFKLPDDAGEEISF